jgi:hypothetical protein
MSATALLCCRVQARRVHTMMIVCPWGVVRVAEVRLAVVQT